MPVPRARNVLNVTGDVAIGAFRAVSCTRIKLRPAISRESVRGSQPPVPTDQGGEIA